eukprot:scaffold11855_cov61-Phaeocystis_antarctica.AAC.2
MRAVSSKVTCPLRPHLVAQQVNLQAGRQHQADLAPRQHLLLCGARNDRRVDEHGRRRPWRGGTAQHDDTRIHAVLQRRDGVALHLRHEHVRHLAHRSVKHTRRFWPQHRRPDES